MKRFPELARRGVALALAASMSLSVFMPGALAADLTTAEEHDHDHDHVHLAAENSVDALGNEDLSDETYNVPGDTAFTAAGAAADPLGGDDEEEIDLDDLTEEQLAEQAVVDAAGHTEHTPDTDAEPVYEQPATCAERGYAIYPCSFTLEQEDGTVAHCYHQVVVWLPLADHAWGEWQEPDDADSQKYRVCTVCNAVEYEDGTVVTPGGIPVTDPDHPEWLPGDIGVGGNYDDQIETLSLTHRGACSFPNDGSRVLEGGWHKYPTCTEWGDARVGCSIWYDWGVSKGYCAGFKEHQAIKPYGHNWQNKTDAAKCETDGKTYQQCSRCGATQNVVAIPKTGHNTKGVKWEKGDDSKVGWIVEPATCTTAGKRYRKCDTCYAEEVDDTYADANPATGHRNADNQVWYDNDPATAETGWKDDKKATCGTAGSRHRTCVNENCPLENKTETQVISATGNHTAGKKTTVAEPKCGVAGKWEIRCTVCNTLLDSGEIPALEHVWDKGTIQQKYPCVDGTITYKCTRKGCDATDVKPYKATEKHKYDEFVSTTQPYPCQPGTETWKCTVCGATTTKAAKVAEHSFGLWTDDDVLGCQTQKQTRTCLVCNYQEHQNSGDPVRKHKYTRYVMITSTEWAEVNIPVDIPNWAVGPLKKIGVRFDDENKHIQIADNMPVPIVIAYCDYGCTMYDKLIATEYPEYAAQAWAATEASKSVANTAEPLIREALADTKTAVNNAQNREEAIAALDQIYAVAKAKLLANGNVPVKVDLRATGTWPSNWPFLGGKQWTVKLYEGTINVPITEEVADQALAQLKNVLDDTKNMLNNSFLSEDAIKVAINKIVDTVAADSGLNESIRQLVFYPIYKSIGKSLGGGRGEGWNNQPTDSTPTETGELILRLAESAVTDEEGWQPFLDAIFDDLIDMLIEQLKKDPEYSKYLNNALGDELLEELRPKLREELVNDTTFVDNIRSIAGEAIKNAAYGVKRGWSDARVLAQLREDLMKVQDPVEQEMLDLSATIGDLVESSLAEKINKLLPFGDLTSWIGKWVGAFAKDKAVSEVVGETGKVRQTIEMYIKYITCGKHDPHTRIAQQASCTNNEMTERYCSKCGWVFEKYKTGDAWGHTPVTVKGYEATETADGLTDGVQCSVCSAWIEPQEVIPAEEPLYEKYLVKSAVTADTAKAAGYKNQKKLDEAIDAALTKAGYQTANSERFLAQVQTSIGILSNDRYPEDGVTGMVKLPAGAAGKNCTFYAVQVLTADTHGYSAGDVVITPLTVTSEGISFKLPVQSVVAIAWKVNE